MNLFVDSGAHLALLDRGDQHHGAAKRFLQQVGPSRFITSTFVLSEVATRGAWLVGARPTRTYIRGILSSPVYHVLDVNREVFRQALEALVKFEDQGLSLTDCTNWVIMRAGRIRTIFSFDKGFRRIGLHTVP
jgi:predicted nucleic acid-binding protein